MRSQHRAATWSGKESTNMNGGNRLIRVTWLWRSAVLGTATLGALAVATWALAGQSDHGTVAGHLAQSGRGSPYRGLDDTGLQIGRSGDRRGLFVHVREARVL